MPSRLSRYGLISAAIWLAGAVTSQAQIVTPKPPAKYDAQIRYRILADRNERVLQFESMAKYFASLGFQENQTDESDLAAFDLQAEMMTGQLPSAKAKELLKDSRVQTVILTPAGFTLPKESQKRVRVEIHIGENRDQLLLFRQIRFALANLGFESDIAYESKQFTRLVGTIPAGRIPLLLRDLRSQPSGWLLPELPDELTLKLPDGTLTPFVARPFADQIPVRIVEVFGLAEAPPSIVKLPPIPDDKKFLEKLTSDLRRKLNEDGVKDAPLRVEIVMTSEPEDGEVKWRVPFIQSGIGLEGRIGSVVTATLPTGSKALEIAELDQVVSIRLPRSSRINQSEAHVEPKKEEPKKESDKKDLSRLGTNTSIRLVSNDSGQLPITALDDDPLKNTGLDRLHALKRAGQNTRVLILDTDFAGWEPRLLKTKQPGFGKVNFVDLTAERHRDLKPEEMPGEYGSGTHAALAVRFAAPMADITLVRIPADAPYQLINVGRYVRGDYFRSEGLITRRNELSADFEEYEVRRKKANDEYQAAFTNFDDEKKADDRRRAAQSALKKLDQEVKLLHDRHDRILSLESQIDKLKGSDIVVSLLSWNTGYALDAASPMSRFLDDWLATSRPVMKTRKLTRPAPHPTPIWIQPAGDQRGQTWTGLFRDDDNNGAMNFAGSDSPLLPGRWSRELNFLGIERGNGDSADLPSGAKIRVSVQWREPHDPELSESDYRAPIAPLKLQLVRQRDPKGDKFATDEVDLIVESEGLPERLMIDPNFGIYEHSLEVTLPAAGRYALRIEGSQPKSIRPASIASLDARDVTWELRPRIFVESADGKGRLKLLDYSSFDGGVPVPADARSVIAVAAVGPDGKPRSNGSTGSGPLAPLARKPNAYAPDYLPKWNDEVEPRGSLPASAFTAGFAASLLSAGIQRDQIPTLLAPNSQGFLKISESWLK